MKGGLEDEKTAGGAEGTVSRGGDGGESGGEDHAEGKSSIVAGLFSRPAVSSGVKRASPREARLRAAMPTLTQNHGS